jgi:hypothetical protein
MHSNGHGWEIEGHRIVDIDTPADWMRAELYARALALGEQQRAAE